MSGLASSFEMLLTPRFLQGVAASATRVLVVAIVRDRYQGSQMARLMSLVFIVFMIVPVLAPAFGQAVLEGRAEENTSELQSILRTSYSVFCVKTQQQTLHKP